MKDDNGYDLIDFSDEELDDLADDSDHLFKKAMDNDKS